MPKAQEKSASAAKANIQPDKASNTTTGAGTTSPGISMDTAGVLKAIEGLKSDLKGDNAKLKQDIGLQGQEISEGQEGDSVTQFIEKLLQSQLQLPEDFKLKIQRAHRALASKPPPGASPRAVIVNFLEFSTKEIILKKVCKKGKIQAGTAFINFDHDYAPEIVKRRKEYNAIKNALKGKGICFQTPFTNMRIHWDTGVRTYASAREAYKELRRHGIQMEEPVTDDGGTSAESRLREPENSSGPAVALRAKAKLHEYQREQND
ncbi:hypothetical protein DPEC_G00259510 [Dallia pectoralis]|uniref:Uncharacterized protein n=1 Tax=Dallia pectoralis TaxID=75939 RepID=A0ACC2FRK3_DALPE|nr:hypothetical protein DPEC_G00259510 [Dallia pectoralis]